MPWARCTNASAITKQQLNILRLNEDEYCDETHRVAPSPQLRRYVSLLRRIEYQPSIAPQTLSSIRSLERARQRNAVKMLSESRDIVETQKRTSKEETHLPDAIEPRDEVSFNFVVDAR